MVTEIKSISVSPELSQLAEQMRISWTEAARVGMSVMLAEMGVQEYDNDLNLFRKMTSYKQKLEELMQRAAEGSAAADHEVAR
jgi:hypothetical protein